MKTRSAILFYIFIVACNFAMGISMLAIPWHYSTQNKYTSFNIYYASVTFASLFFGYALGTFLDMYNRKHVLICYFLPLALLLMVPIIIGQNNYIIILIFALQFIGYVLFYPAIYSIIKDSFHPTKYILHTIIVEFIGQSTVIISAALGVLLIEGIDEPFSFLGRTGEIKLEAFPLEKIFMLSGISLLLSLIFLSFMNYKKRNNKENNKNYWSQFSIGIQYMVIEKKLFLILVLSSFVFISLIIERIDLLAKHITNFLDGDSEIFSISESCYRGGAIISSLIILLILFFAKNVWRKITLKIFLYIVSTPILIVAILFIVSSFSTNIEVFYKVSFGFGLLNASSRVFRQIFIFYNVPNKYFARTNSLSNVFTTLIRLFFILFFSIPFFNKSNTISYAYLILGIFTLFGALYLFSIVRNKKELIWKN